MYENAFPYQIIPSLGGFNGVLFTLFCVKSIYCQTFLLSSLIKIWLFHAKSLYNLLEFSIIYSTVLAKLGLDVIVLNDDLLFFNLKNFAFDVLGVLGLILGIIGAVEPIIKGVRFVLDTKSKGKDKDDDGSKRNGRIR